MSLKVRFFTVLYKRYSRNLPLIAKSQDTLIYTHKVKAVSREDAIEKFYTDMEYTVSRIDRRFKKAIFRKVTLRKSVKIIDVYSGKRVGTCNCGRCNNSPALLVIPSKQPRWTKRSFN